MKKRAPCLLCGIALAALAAAASAQQSHDALAPARAHAEAHNQHVLLLLTGGDDEVGEELGDAMANYRKLGKLLRYEYQVAAVPADSVAGIALRTRLGITDLALPALLVLTTDDQVLETFGARLMLDGDDFATEQVHALLGRHKRAPQNAREVLAAGLAAAKKNKRHAFIYLSAPW